MFKHKIEYTDYNGNARSKELAFNLSAMELIDLQRSTPGGYGELLTRVAENGDGLEVWGLFEDLVKRSYGEVVDDGTRFVKKDENGRPLVDKFVESPAYEAFMMEMITNGELGGKFISALIPQESVDKVKAMTAAAAQ